MDRSIGIVSVPRQGAGLRQELKIELVRKTIHLSIALVPTLASYNISATLGLLAAGVLVYAACESLRMAGRAVPLVSTLTFMAARRRDAGKFVMGPITLGLGAMLSLLLYPDPAASLAIYALAFGDGLSSLVGKFFGTIRLPLTGGKSLEGSLTCFGAVFISAYALTGRPLASMALGLVATLVEALPLKDLDNIVLPVLTGAFATLIF